MAAERTIDIENIQANGGVGAQSRFARIAAVAVAALMLASCGSKAPSQQTPADVAEGAGMAASGGSCDVLSAAEVSTVIGAKVEDAVDVGGGCTFNYAGGSDYAATLQRMPSSAYGPGGAKPEGYREIPGVGDAAWLGRGYQNNWTAQAQRGEKAINVAVGGPAANPETAVALLKAALSKA